MPLVEQNEDSFAGAPLFYEPPMNSIKKQDSILRTDYSHQETAPFQFMVEAPKPFLKAEDTTFASNIDNSVFINQVSHVQSAGKALEESPKLPVESVASSELIDQKKIKTDQVVKKIWRLFRHLIKEKFFKLYDKKYYHWIEKTKRQKTQAFFIENYQVSQDFYKRNEEVFFKLVHNTSFEEGDAVSQNFQKVFGNHPNKKNLKEFFKMEAILYLWWGITDGDSSNDFVGFSQSQELKDFLSGFSTSN